MNISHISPKKQIFKLFILFTLAICLFPPEADWPWAETLSPDPVGAQDMSSESFQIQGGNFNMTSGNKGSETFKLADVVGQVAAQVFTSKGYIINAGFLNAAGGEFFGLSVSPPTIDFGSLLPNIPVEKSLIIGVTTGNFPGYTVSVAENHPLKTLLEAEIPDSSCNSDSPCSPNQAGIWSGSGKPGFGYHMDGKTVTKDFAQSSSFRPFAAVSQNIHHALIMQSNAKKVSDNATMTIKVLVDQNQAVGQYKNMLQFTALIGL